MFQKLRHFQSLNDLLLFFHIIGLWCCLPCILLFPLERVLRFLTPGKTDSSDPGSATGRRQKIMLFANYWFSRRYIAKNNTCLKKSLTLYYFLNRDGIPVRFCLGIRNDDGNNLSGHSWIEERTCTDPKNKNCDGFIEIYSYPQEYVENIYNESKLRRH